MIGYRFSIFIMLLAYCFICCCANRKTDKIQKEEADDKIEENTNNAKEAKADEPIYDASIITYDTLLLSLGDTAMVDLLSQSSTGKMWLITDENKFDKVEIIEKGDYTKRNEELPKNYQYFKFKTLQKGEFEIEYINKRPFGEDVGEVKILKQQIIIK